MFPCVRMCVLFFFAVALCVISLSVLYVYNKIFRRYRVADARKYYTNLHNLLFNFGERYNTG